MNRFRSAACALVATAVLTSPAAVAAPLWKIINNAFLRINDEGVKEWSVYQIEKKDDRFLLQVGDRYLLIVPEAKQIFDLDSADIAHEGPDLLWDPAKTPAKPVATSAWLVRDVGFARRIKMHIEAEDRTMDLQIPHPYSRR